MKHKIVIEFETAPLSSDQEMRLSAIAYDMLYQLETLNEHSIDYTNPRLHRSHPPDEFVPREREDVASSDKEMVFQVLDDPNRTAKTKKALQEHIASLSTNSVTTLPAAQFLQKNELKCDCGGEKANTTHSHWCQTVMGVKNERENW